MKCMSETVGLEIFDCQHLHKSKSRSPSTQECSSVIDLLFTHQAHCLSEVFMSHSDLTIKCKHCCK